MADIDQLQQRGLVSPRAAQRFYMRQEDIPPPRDSAATAYLKRGKKESYDDWSARHDAFGAASLPHMQAYSQKIGKAPEQWSAGDIFRFQDSPEIKNLIKQLPTGQ